MFAGGSEIELHRVGDAFASVELAAVGHLTIGRVRSSGHDVNVREPHSLTLLVPLSGQILVEDRLGKYVARPGSALLIPTGNRRTRVEAAGVSPFVGIPILLSGSEFEKRGGSGRLSATVAINGSRSRLHAQAIRMATLLQDELHAGTGLLERPSAECSWTELMTEIVVDIVDQANGRSLVLESSGSVTARRVRQAEDYMRAHLSEIATVSDVARVQGISSRSLEIAFQNELGLSPLSFLNSLRLSEARRMLLSDNEFSSVTEVCLACGIGHAGRFATTYRQRFAELPSETLSRKRA